MAELHLLIPHPSWAALNRTQRPWQEAVKSNEDDGDTKGWKSSWAEVNDDEQLLAMEQDSSYSIGN